MPLTVSRNLTWPDIKTHQSESSMALSPVSDSYRGQPARRPAIPATNQPPSGQSEDQLTSRLGNKPLNPPASL